LLAVYVFSPSCDYYDWAWGGDIRECKCLGFKIDTSLKGAMDLTFP